MLPKVFGQLCWNTSLDPNKDYDIYTGSVYLTIVKEIDREQILLLSSSNHFPIMVKSEDDKISEIKSVADFAVTDQTLLVVVSGVMYSTSMQDIVTAIKNNSNSLVLHQVNYRFEDELELPCNLKSSSIKEIKATANEVFALYENGVLFKLSVVNSCNSCSILDVLSQISVQQLACGSDHCILLTNDGLVFSFGIGSRGQLGHGELADLTSPKQLESLQVLSIVSVSAGGWHSAFLSSTGDLYLCGWNESMQLGIINLSLSSVPEPLDLPPEIFNDKMLDEVVRGVSCGMRHTVLWTERNAIFCLGGTTDLSDNRKVLLDKSFNRVSIGHKSNRYHGDMVIACKSMDFGFFVYYPNH